MKAEALGALREKYIELRRLREEDAAGAVADPKPAMAALAARFPGALRQIDRLPLDVIGARLAELNDAIASGRDAPAWALLEAAYHGRMRATLRVKSAVRGALDDADALVRASEVWAREPDEPTEALNAERLAEIREPAGGRLNPMVVAAVATERGVDVDEVRAALYFSVRVNDCGGDA